MVQSELKKKFTELESKYNHVFGTFNKRIINRTKLKLIDINWKPLLVIPVVLLILNIWSPKWVMYTEKVLTKNKETTLIERVHQPKIFLISLVCYIITISILNYSDLKHFMREQFDLYI